MAVTEALDYIATELEKGLKEGKKLTDAVKTLLTKMIKENKRIIFNGNNYADEWQKEAAKRGLLNLRTSVDAYAELMKPDVVKAFEKYGVLNERELHARYEVALEHYNKTINIEAQLMVLMANRYILPAAYKYQGTLAQTRRGGQGGRRDGEGDAKRARQIVHAALDKLQDTRRQAAGAARARRHGERGEAREVLPRQGHSRDGRAARSRATRSNASSRTTCGRCRPIGRCCSFDSPIRFRLGRRGFAAPFFCPRSAVAVGLGFSRAVDIRWHFRVNECMIGDPCSDFRSLRPWP